MSVLDIVDFSQVTTDGGTFIAGSSGDPLVGCQLLSGMPTGGGAERYLNDQGWLKVASLTAGARRFTITDDTTVLTLLPTINSQYNLTLTASDVVDGPVHMADGVITLTAGPTSIWAI